MQRALRDALQLLDTAEKQLLNMLTPKILKELRDTDKQTKIARLAKVPKQYVSYLEQGCTQCIPRDALLRLVAVYANL